MFKILDTAEERIKLHSLAEVDGVDRVFPCTHSEWVQTLVNTVGNSRWMVWAYFDEQEQIKAYIVVTNNVIPPLADYVQIIYYYSDADEKVSKELLELVKEWARAVRATKINFTTSLPSYIFEKYGFEQKAIIMELDV